MAACESAPEDAPGTTFVPLSKDFAGFRSWTRLDLGVSPADSVHEEGRRVIYANRLPSTGSTVFPVGTILVKTIGEDSATPGKTFGMAKRGGTYNTNGAVGWEWFEVQENTEGAVLFVWRGISPPAGEGYGGAVVGGSCNTCHGTAASNDYVMSAALRLGGI
jgi:hypothetical protein